MTDRELIEHLGGSTKLAAILSNVDESYTVQRVNNWKVRGIPPQVKIDFPHLFLMPINHKHPIPQAS